MARTLTIDIATNMPRHEAIEAVKTATRKTSGWIVDHTLLSNKAVMIRACVDAPRLPDFLAALTAVRLLPEEMDPVLRDKAAQAASGSDLTVTLAMTFRHDEPDLRQVIPAIPG